MRKFIKTRYKKNIVFVYHSLSNGGVEIEILNYFKLLKSYRNKINFFLILTNRQGDLAPLVPKYVNLLQVKGKGEKIDFEYILNMFICLKKIKPDTVIGFMQDINLNLLIIKSIFFMNFKLIITEHTHLSGWQFFFKTNIIKKFLVRQLYPKADMCFAISKPVAEDLSINFHINKNKVHIVRNYFSRKIFKYKKRRENYLLYIGRISDEKNLDVMLEAYSKLKEIAYKKQPKLVIVGNGNISSLVKKSCSLNIYKDIIIQGYKRNVYNFYQNAIALLLPSRIEGGPRVGFESMIIGCPIISSDFIGRDKTIFSKNKVFLFQNNSVPSLLKTILLVLDKPDLRKRRATLARNKMKSIYSSNFYNNHSKHIFNLIY